MAEPSIIDDVKKEIQTAISEMVIQKIAEVGSQVATKVTGRPHDIDLIKAVEDKLNSLEFKRLTRKTLSKLKIEDNSPLRTSRYFDDAFIGKPHVQKQLVQYFITGDDSPLMESVRNYAENLRLKDAEPIQQALKAFLAQLRLALYENDTFRAIVVAKDAQSLQEAFQQLNHDLTKISENMQKIRRGVGAIQRGTRSIRQDTQDIKKQLTHLTRIVKRKPKSAPSPFAHISAGYAATLYTTPGAVQNEQAPQMKTLIGRADIQAEILGKLSANERVLIQGFGGEGKTALAATVADEWLRANKGAVLWLRAGSATAAVLAEACAGTFNAQEHIAKASDEKNKLAVLKQILQKTSVTLLVLDDGWEPAAITALIKQGIPGNIAILITSRKQIAVNHKIPLAALDTAAALLVLKSHVTIAASDEPAARALCATLYGSPFALEIAGITLRENGWSAAEMLAKIEDEKLKMMLPDEAGETGRENIAALIAASVNALPDAAKNVFSAWGAFFVPTITPLLMMYYFEVTSPPDPLSKHGEGESSPLPVVWGGDEAPSQGALGVGSKTPKDGEGTESALLDLQKHGLATRVPPADNAVAHYRLHDLAFEYTQKLATAEMKQNALAACLRYTARYKAPSLPNFAALRPELPQFMAAAKFAEQHQRYADVEQFAWDLDGGDDAGILSLQGYYSLALSLLEQAAKAAKAAGNQHNESAHLGNLGLAYDSLGQYPKAIEYHEQALTISREIGDRRGEGAHLGNLGIAYAALGQYQTAIAYYEQAIVIQREIGDRRGEGNQLGNLGNAYFSLGDYPKAIEYHEQAIVIQREIGDRRGEGNDLDGLGLAYNALGDHAKAIDFYEQALLIRREIGDKRGEGGNLNNLGVAHEDQEKYVAALDYYEQAKAVFAALGLDFKVEKMDRMIAELREKMGNDS